jgi:hypothetical protein
MIQLHRIALQPRETTVINVTTAWPGVQVIALLHLAAIGSAAEIIITPRRGVMW